jgi:hypothetical protein
VPQAGGHLRHVSRPDRAPDQIELAPNRPDVRVPAGAKTGRGARIAAAKPSRRRAHSAGLSANKDFVEGFASKFHPLLMTQEVKLLHAAPWGSHP